MKRANGLRSVYQCFYGAWICKSNPRLDYTKVRAACIGKQTKAEADAVGMETYMAKKATIDSVLDLVIELKEKTATEQEEQ